MERLRSTEQELGKAAAALSVEHLPEIKSARIEAKAEALAILESRKPAAESWEFESPNLAANPITAAERLLAAEENFGPDSRQYKEARKAALTDCRRALMESYRKSTWEFFPPLLQPYDRNNRSFTFHGRSLLELTEDGLRWDSKEEERQRLVNEYVEERTYSALIDNGQARTHWVLTISQCPDHALSDGGKGYGYVPEINKMMLRGVGLLDNSPVGQDLETRYTEQVGLPGRIIDEDVVHKALEELGAIQPGQRLDKTEMQGTQFLIDKSKLGGVLDFVEFMDDLAGPDVFMGEFAPESDRDYTQIITEAKAREWLLNEQSAELTDYMLELARQGADQIWAAGQIEAKINQLIHQRAQTNPLIARQAFDAATAQGYEQAIMLDRQGKYEDAGKLRVKTKHEAPPAAYCGAGSCGLREANPFEQTQGELLGLSGPLILDTIRRCPKGHANAVLYDHKGNKACRQCKLTQKAGSIKVFKGKSDQGKLKRRNKKNTGLWS